MPGAVGLLYFVVDHFFIGLITICLPKDPHYTTFGLRGFPAKRKCKGYYS